MGDKVIHNNVPDNNEDTPGAELHAAYNGTRDEGGRNDSEHELVDAVENVGDSRSIVTVGVASYVFQTTPAEIAHAG